MTLTPSILPQICTDTRKNNQRLEYKKIRAAPKKHSMARSQSYHGGVQLTLTASWQRAALQRPFMSMSALKGEGYCLIKRTCLHPEPPKHNPSLPPEPLWTWSSIYLPQSEEEQKCEWSVRDFCDLYLLHGQGTSLNKSWRLESGTASGHESRRLYNGMQQTLPCQFYQYSCRSYGAVLIRQHLRSGKLIWSWTSNTEKEVWVHRVEAVHWR